MEVKKSNPLYVRSLKDYSDKELYDFIKLYQHVVELFGGRNFCYEYDSKVTAEESGSIMYLCRGIETTWSKGDHKYINWYFINAHQKPTSIIEELIEELKPTAKDKRSN